MNLGMTEILIIMVIALIVFGPRKLPELGKSLGQALAQFRRASDDFKRTWEQEVELEKHKTTLSGSSETAYHSDQADHSYTADSTYHYDPYSDAAHSGAETATEHADAGTPATQTATPAQPAVVAAHPHETTGKAPQAGHWI